MLGSAKDGVCASGSFPMPRFKEAKEVSQNEWPSEVTVHILFS